MRYVGPVLAVVITPTLMQVKLAAVTAIAALILLLALRC
jgi:hypothetical protein